MMVDLWIGGGVLALFSLDMILINLQEKKEKALSNAEEWRRAVLDWCLKLGVDYDGKTAVQVMDELFTPDTHQRLEIIRIREMMDKKPVPDGYRRWTCALCGVPNFDAEGSLKCLGAYGCTYCGMTCLRPAPDFNEAELKEPCQHCELIRMGKSPTTGSVN